MRIAFIVGSFPALSLTFVQNQITGLIDLGHEVDIFAQMARNESKVHPAIAEYDLLERTYYWQVPSEYVLRVSNAVKAFAVASFTHKKSLLRSLNFLKLGSQALSLRSFYQTLTFMHHRSYDVIQCHFGGFGNLGLLMKELNALQGALVTSFHGFDLSMQLEDLNHNPYEKLFNQGELMLPISHLWKDRLIKLGCPSDKIKIHRMGIDLEKFKFKPRELFKGGDVKIISVSRLTEKKGLEYAIKAVSNLIKEYPSICYRIAGTGELKDSLSKLIKALGVEKHISFIGAKTQDEVIMLMQEADIFLAPSVTSRKGDKEGIPVALMEALAVGIPIVSTIHSGIPELIQDGKNGMLALEKNVNELGRKIEYLIKNKDLASRMVRSGRAIVEEKHDIRRLNIHLVNIYENLLP